MQFSLMNDFMFKKYFSMEDNLRTFLELLEIPIGNEKISIEPTEVKDSIYAKGSRFDVRVCIGNKSIDLEAQNQLVSGYDAHIRRQIHYASQIHSGLFKEGETYETKRQTYVIFVDNFDIPGKKCITTKKLYNDNTGDFYDDIVIIDVSLKKSNKCANIELRELLEALSTTKAKKFKTKAAKEAMELIEYFNKDDQAIIDAQRALRANLIENTIKESAKKEGLAKGRAEGFANAVLAMYNNGISVEEISNLLSITTEAVNDIISSK